MIVAAPLAPNTPEWLLLTTIVILLILIVGATGWGGILEIRYTSPYTLLAASSDQKWRRAAILAFLQTSMFPLLGLAQPVLSPYPDQWPAFPLFCGGVWIVVLPLDILYKRWDLERSLKNYRKMDVMIKQGVFKRMLALPFFSWTRWFMNAEHRRFFEEGYPDNGAA